MLFRTNCMHYVAEKQLAARAPPTRSPINFLLAPRPTGVFAQVGPSSFQGIIVVQSAKLEMVPNHAGHFTQAAGVSSKPVNGNHAGRRKATCWKSGYRGETAIARVELQTAVAH